jgi:hypothetical protein
MISLTFWPNLDAKNAGTPWRVESWDAVFEKLSERRPYLGDFEHPGWSPAEFKPCFREKAHVQSVSALCLDFDQGGTIDDAVERLSAIAGGFLHTTRKHTEEAHRFRVVLPLARPVSAFEFPELWKRVAPVAGSVDPAAKDASRFWFVAGTSGPFETRRWDGPALNPDEWLAKPDPTKPVVNVTPAPRESASVEERARKYIAKMPEAIAGQGGHAACWEVALYLTRGFALSHDRALAILREEYSPRCVPPWSERELEHKIAGAMKSERVPFGFLLNDNREWRPRSHQLPPPPDDDYIPEAPDEYEPEYDGGALLPESKAPVREPGDDSGEQVPPQSATERYGVVELRSLCFEVLEEAKAGKVKQGHTTGHYAIDAVLAGLRPEHVTLLAAPTSWGKSSFGVMIADENLKVNVPVLVVTVEDSKIMYGKRIVARRAKVNALNLRDNTCDRSELQAIEAAARAAQSEPFLLSGVGKTVEYVGRAIRELVAERKIGVVVCDYIQRFRTNKHAGDRRNQVTYVAEVLSDAIKSSGASGVLLSQLKRTDGRVPTMDDVKESGDLENMAEHVLLGHKEQEKKARWEGDPEPPWKRTLWVPKNKDGPTSTGQIECPFNEVTASFETVEDPELGRLERLAAAARGEEEAVFGDFDARYP